jgi:hypothetical protein
MAKFRRMNISNFVKLRTGAAVVDNSGTVLVSGAAAEINTTTKSVSAVENGEVFFLSLAAGFVTTLPAPALGLRYSFVVRTAPTSGAYTIVTTSSANIIKGSIYTSDVNSATDADFETAGGDTITFVQNKAVAGDKVDLVSDGTNWFAYGFCTVFDAITVTTAS